jgi:hypothetical protein
MRQRATRRLSAMVIVLRNRTVNQIQRLRGKPNKQGIAGFRGRSPHARVYIPFIANLKLPFKFDRS